MLEVGVTNSQRSQCTQWGQAGCTLNLVEARTHFSAWAVVSAPLVLGNDLTDEATMDAIWPIITNKDVLAVNDAWAGDSGVLLAQSSASVHLSNCSWFNAKGCDHPAWMVWKKDLPGGKVAVLLINNGATAVAVSVDFAALKGVECLGGSCCVRDVHAQKDIGMVAGTFTATIGTHDSAFIIVAPSCRSET
jgi:alpha-galactosidase